MKFKLIGLIILILLIICLFLNKPINSLDYNSDPLTINDYNQSLERIELLQSEDSSDIDPVCKTKYMTHGIKVKKVIIFLHGYTNCPKQFEELGKIFFDQGYNVLIPRLPHHGKLDKLTPDLQNLTAEEVISFTDQILDTSHGLGEEISIVGLSGSGVVTAWVAQNRADVNRAVIIAPSLGVSGPKFFTLPVTNFFLGVPNHFFWWDPKLKEKRLGPPQAYPRYSSHGLAQIFRIGLLTMNEATTQKPLSKSILVITNQNDNAVNNDLTKQMVKQWEKYPSVEVTNYEFPQELNLIHDIIDPSQPEQKTNLVYPILLELINK